jgi:hypothetical protein
MQKWNDGAAIQLDEESYGIFIPSKPDVGIRIEIERAISSNFANCCCQVEMHLRADVKSVLYSLDSDGRRKTTGGDEFYVRYEEFTLVNIDGDEKVSKEIATQAVAFITDHDDGSYELDFCTTPMHPNPSPRTHTTTNKTDCSDNEEKIIRNITIHFEYTDNMGFLSPPSKQDWLNGGYSHKQYNFELPTSLYRPFIRVFSPPTQSVDLSKFDQVFAFGDSTFCQFMRQRPNKKGKYYFQENLRIIGEKVRTGLNSKTVDTLLELIREDDIVERELSNNFDMKKKALVVGSCLWDILSADDTLQGSEFKDHCDACRKYVYRLRQRYPGVTLLWKSPMAVHIHWVDLQRVVEHDRAAATLFGINRIKYMSSSRSCFLYKMQRKIMEELRVPMLELYEATHLSADQLYPSDGRHYKPDLNRKMLSWFYPGPDIDPNERVYFRHVI